MRRSGPPCARLRRSAWKRRRTWALAAAALAAGLCGVAPASYAAAPSLIVIPNPASGSLSYFKLSIRHGHLGQAGTIGVRNPTGRPLRVALDPVAGRTIDTLGSTYGLRGSGAREPASWVRLGRRRITLAAGATAVVPVSVLAPRDARPGDYLAGIAVEQLGQRAQSTARRGVSVASVVRYAIGVEASVPGPRHPLIRFTGARLERQPAGLAFLLEARNPGNVILQNVAGRALVTRGSRVVARVALGPGTFVTGTSIAYPILAPRERPPQGTAYRVRAYLRYVGGIARLDTLVRFGRAAALRQQLYGGPKAGASSGLPGWLVALLSVLGAGLLSIAAALLVRRRRAGGRSPARTIDAALQAAQRSGAPVSLISVSLTANGASPQRLAPVLRSRIRHSDRLCRLDALRFLVVAPDTDLQTAETLASDLRRHAERAEGVTADVEVAVHEADPNSTGPELLQRIRTAPHPMRAPRSTG
ncbi:MAG: hypothetical protein E6G34_13765 [Actinobacteria bacterium]|nr:MAG: hypothetical protein E6G34_13765 [Actinomycetota bacterium]